MMGVCDLAQSLVGMTAVDGGVKLWHAECRVSTGGLVEALLLGCLDFCLSLTGQKGQREDGK
jgi:hypothetical protein